MKRCRFQGRRGDKLETRLLLYLREKSHALKMKLRKAAHLFNMEPGNTKCPESKIDKQENTLIN